MTKSADVKMYEKGLSKLESASQRPFKIMLPDEIVSLADKAKDIMLKIKENQGILESKKDSIVCPVCQGGELLTTVRGKIFRFIPDKWLICNKCNAEFDKKRETAVLVKAPNDPYNIYAKYSNQTLPVEKWKEIGLNKIKEEISGNEAQLSEIKSKFSNFISEQFLEGKVTLILIDIKSFMLKPGEMPLFGTIAEVIEERKRRLTQRTTVGGVRNYGGFSFRIAKGLYGHLGSSAPASPSVTTIQSTEYTELITADVGDFLVTDQRLMFKGERSRGLSIPWKQLMAIDIDPEEKALLLTRENKKPSILKLLLPDKGYLRGVEISYSVSVEQIVEVIIKGAIQKHQESEGQKSSGELSGDRPKRKSKKKV